jgi:alpha-L-arabinofuranosidase
VKGVATVRKDASGEMLTGADADVNTVADPMKVAPRPVTITNAAPTFAHELPARSVTVIRLKTR